MHTIINLTVLCIYKIHAYIAKCIVTQEAYTPEFHLVHFLESSFSSSVVFLF